MRAGVYNRQGHKLNGGNAKMATDHKKFADVNPAPYQGTVIEAGTSQAANQRWTIIEAANYYDLPELIDRCGDWVISKEGIHCLYTDYYISKSRFDKLNWIEQVTGKTWVNKSDFITVFETAKAMVANGTL